MYFGDRHPVFESLNGVVNWIGREDVEMVDVDVLSDVVIFILVTYCKVSVN